MDFMPFADISDGDFRVLFPVNYDLAYDDEGEWVYCHGHWYLASDDRPHIGDQDPLNYNDPDADDIYDLDYAAY